MNTIPEINIHAYFSPHPLDEDSFLENDWISWLPGFVNEDEEDGLPAYLHEENLLLYKRIETFAADLFKAALHRMWPLLKDYHFRNIQIAIDYSGCFTSNASLAGYNHELSSPGKGQYVFHVNPILLKQYAGFLIDSNASHPKINLWAHELIHLIDHWQIVNASAFAHSENPSNNLKYYMLKYREEGIANLFDLLDGKISGISSIHKAKETFVSKYSDIKQRLEGCQSTNRKDREDIYKGYDFYEVGPWLILDMLSEFEMVWKPGIITEIENKIINNLKIEDELKLDVLQMALRIDNDWFLSRIQHLPENHPSNQP